MTCVPRYFEGCRNPITRKTKLQRNGLSISVRSRTGGRGKTIWTVCQRKKKNTTPPPPNQPPTTTTTENSDVQLLGMDGLHLCERKRQTTGENLACVTSLWRKIQLIVSGWAKECKRGGVEASSRFLAGLGTQGVSIGTHGAGEGGGNWESSVRAKELNGTCWLL